MTKDNNDVASYKVNGEKITIDIRHNESVKKSINLDVVVDFDDFNEPVGVECLGLTNQLGENALDGFAEALRDSSLRYSYDPDCDAFYLSLSDGRSMGQSLMSASVTLDDSGRVVRITIVR